MHLITSRHELRDAPDVREPDSEAIHAHPEQYAARLRAALPIGTTVTEIRRIDYFDDLHDRCTALLLGMERDGHYRLALNELGEDPMNEMAAAGRALAKVMRVPYVEGEPDGWPKKQVSFLARLLGYAA